MGERNDTLTFAPQADIDRVMMAGLRAYASDGYTGVRGMGLFANDAANNRWQRSLTDASVDRMIAGDIASANQFIRRSGGYEPGPPAGVSQGLGLLLGTGLLGNGSVPYTVATAQNAFASAGVQFNGQTIGGPGVVTQALTNEFLGGLEKRGLTNMGFGTARGGGWNREQYADLFASFTQNGGLAGVNMGSVDAQGKVQIDDRGMRSADKGVEELGKLVNVMASVFVGDRGVPDLVAKAQRLTGIVGNTAEKIQESTRQAMDILTQARASGAEAQSRMEDIMAGSAIASNYADSISPGMGTAMRGGGITARISAASAAYADAVFANNPNAQYLGSKSQIMATELKQQTKAFAGDMAYQEMTMLLAESTDPEERERIQRSMQDYNKARASGDRGAVTKARAAMMKTYDAVAPGTEFGSLYRNSSDEDKAAAFVKEREAVDNFREAGAEAGTKAAQRFTLASQYLAGVTGGAGRKGMHELFSRYSEGTRNKVMEALASGGSLDSFDKLTGAGRADLEAAFGGMSADRMRSVFARYGARLDLYSNRYGYSKGTTEDAEAGERRQLDAMFQAGPAMSKATLVEQLVAGLQGTTMVTDKMVADYMTNAPGFADKVGKGTYSDGKVTFDDEEWKQAMSAMSSNMGGDKALFSAMGVKDADALRAKLASDPRAVKKAMQQANKAAKMSALGGEENGTKTLSFVSAEALEGVRESLNRESRAGDAQSRIRAVQDQLDSAKSSADTAAKEGVADARTARSGDTRITNTSEQPVPVIIVAGRDRAADPSQAR